MKECHNMMNVSMIMTPLVFLIKNEKTKDYRSSSYWFCWWFAEPFLIIIIIKITQYLYNYSDNEAIIFPYEKRDKTNIPVAFHYYCVYDPEDTIS